MTASDLESVQCLRLALRSLHGAAGHLLYQPGRAAEHEAVREAASEVEEVIRRLQARVEVAV